MTELIVAIVSAAISLASLIYIYKIKKNAEEMEKELWGKIHDLSMIQNAETIMNLKEKGKKVEGLIRHWEREFGCSQADINKEKDQEYKEYLKTYKPAYEDLSQMMK